MSKNNVFYSVLAVLDAKKLIKLVSLAVFDQTVAFLVKILVRNCKKTQKRREKKALVFIGKIAKKSRKQ